MSNRPHMWKSIGFVAYGITCYYGLRRWDDDLTSAQEDQLRGVASNLLEKLVSTGMEIRERQFLLDHLHLPEPVDRELIVEFHYQPPLAFALTPM